MGCGLPLKHLPCGLVYVIHDAGLPTVEFIVEQEGTGRDFQDNGMRLRVAAHERVRQRASGSDMRKPNILPDDVKHKAHRMGKTAQDIVVMKHWMSRH